MGKEASAHGRGMIGESFTQCTYQVKAIQNLHEPSTIGRLTIFLMRSQLLAAVEIRGALDIFCARPEWFLEDVSLANYMALSHSKLSSRLCYNLEPELAAAQEEQEEPCALGLHDRQCMRHRLAR